MQILFWYLKRFKDTWGAVIIYGRGVVKIRGAKILVQAFRGGIHERASSEGGGGKF